MPRRSIGPLSRGDDRTRLVLSFLLRPSQIVSEEQLVTPYYLAGSIRRTSDGRYSLGGSIGVIHQEFEEIWMEREENRARGNALGTSLLIANIKELSDLGYVRPETFKDEVDRFAAALCEFLGKMPQNET